MIKHFIDYPVTVDGKMFNHKLIDLNIYLLQTPIYIYIFYYNSIYFSLL